MIRGRDILSSAFEISSLKKERNPICNRVDESQRLYAKWKRPVG